MNTNSLFGKIITVIAFFVLASIVLSLAFSIIGGLIGLVFRFGIPLLIAIGIVKWLTDRRVNRHRNHY